MSAALLVAILSLLCLLEINGTCEIGPSRACPSAAGMNVQFAITTSALTATSLLMKLYITVPAVKAANPWMKTLALTQQQSPSLIQTDTLSLNLPKMVTQWIPAKRTFCGFPYLLLSTMQRPDLPVYYTLLLPSFSKQASCSTTANSLKKECYRRFWLGWLIAPV